MEKIPSKVRSKNVKSKADPVQAVETHRFVRH
jgi:hypothetical protein